MIGGAIAFLVARGLSSLVASLIVWGVIAAGVAGAVFFVHHEWDVNVLEPARVEGDERTTKRLQPTIDALRANADGAIRERDTARQERDTARADLKTALSANAVLVERIDGPGGLVAQISASKKSVARWQAVVSQLRATNAALTKKLDAAIASSEAAVAKAKAIVAGPAASSFEESCHEADRILGDLARRMNAT